MARKSTKEIPLVPSLNENSIQLNSTYFFCLWIKVFAFFCKILSNECVCQTWFPHACLTTQQMELCLSRPNKQYSLIWYSNPGKPFISSLAFSSAILIPAVIRKTNMRRAGYLLSVSLAWSFLLFEQAGLAILFFKGMHNFEEPVVRILRKTELI